MLSTSRAGVVNENRMWWRISGGRVENDGVVDTGWGLRAMSVTTGPDWGGIRRGVSAGDAGRRERRKGPKGRTPVSGFWSGLFVGVCGRRGEACGTREETSG